MKRYIVAQDEAVTNQHIQFLLLSLREGKPRVTEVKRSGDKITFKYDGVPQEISISATYDDIKKYLDF